MGMDEVMIASIANYKTAPLQQQHSWVMLMLTGCRDHVCLTDLEQLLPKEKAARALKVLDVDGDGKVSLHDMRDAVIQIYNERKNLAFTLKDTWTVVGKLEFVIGISIHLLFGFFYLLIFEVSTVPWLVQALVLGLLVCLIA